MIKGNQVLIYYQYLFLFVKAHKVDCGYLRDGDARISFEGISEFIDEQKLH